MTVNVLSLMSSVLGLFYALGGLITAAYAVRVAVNTWLYLRHRDETPAPSPPEECPTSVTIQLPIFNERLVAARAIDAACRIRWPRELLEIQVLDDSNDETREIVDGAAAAWRARGVDVKVVRRNHQSGFKAGALQAGLGSARGDAIAVFDADFVPHPDFLERTIPHLGGSVAAVQARWTHLNADSSGLTRAQALALDGYFVIEQTARARAGLALNFNGSGGVWRRAAIDAGGGWRGDTLTEDVDLSFRTQLAGWHIVFLPDVEAPAELPSTVLGFKVQQRRWARGTVQCARRLIGPVWRSDWPLGKRIHALSSLTNHLVQPVLLAMLIGMPVLLALRPSIHPLIGLLSITALNLPGQHAIAQKALWGHPAWLRKLMAYPLLAIIGVGMSLNGTIAVLGAFRRDGGGFERTPKRGAGEAAVRMAEEGQQLEHAGAIEPYALHFDRQSIGEALMAIYAWSTLAMAMSLGAWGALPFAGTAALGFTFVAGGSIREALIAAPSGDRRRSTFAAMVAGLLALRADEAGGVPRRR